MTSEIRVTLTQFLIESRRQHPHATGEFNSLLLNIALVCKRIARKVAAGALHGAPGEARKTLGAASGDMFIEGNNWGGNLAGMASEEMAAPYQIPRCHPRGRYLLVFDALDGASNIDVNLSVGSIFSVLRAPDAASSDSTSIVTEQDFLQPGAQQVAAGYAIYGPATMLVLSVGAGVHGFTLCPQMGEFMLTHPGLSIPPDTCEFAINASNSRFWEEPVKRYVNECMAGKSGRRGMDFNMRWIASMVAEAHRILMRGGVFLYPRDTRDAAMPGRVRLLYEANPIAFLVEQAGGRASTGRQPVMTVRPESLGQRVGLVFGSRHEVERIERYHHTSADDLPNPLFRERSLFRTAV
ncbi:class 1 fructose-bisphosphatase [Noviherbaspirillum sp. UKPF54]|uniref:class 1 fructose-bisphosphatase n=1 Tax=Noviherbaspirillum sp. UKPF54 TaxID=2601898 RepID=UPI0011B10EE9|nr:class 1 fructose-bisphosphatase [Noviherbaspirillum sp. UKPF54]QDZ29421.1 class 1 fructose-bisphosphatase [Noviherbaspirillum sp. UKPF54]